jgi:hypothetical protein
MKQTVSRNRRIMVRFAASDRAKLERVAERERRPTAQLLRAIVLDWLDGQRRQQTEAAK